MVFGKAAVEGEQTIKEQVSSLAEAMKNPYFNIYHWVKGEIYDIEAVNDAITTKDKIQSNIQKNEKKKRSTQENLDNVTTGRKTVKTIFKNQDDAGKMVNKIENVSKIMSVIEFRLIKKSKDLLFCMISSLSIWEKGQYQHSRRSELESTTRSYSNSTLCRSTMRIKQHLSGLKSSRTPTSNTRWTKNE